jgi:murein DD-endopeptidase MepM/ murein hydrolase activator NlpD
MRNIYTSPEESEKLSNIKGVHYMAENSPLDTTLRLPRNKPSTLEIFLNFAGAEVFLGEYQSHEGMGPLQEENVRVEIVPGDTTMVTWKITVQPGDTLSQIANIYDTDIETLAALNNIADIGKIRAGDTIEVPLSPTGAASIFGNDPFLTDTSVVNPAQPNEQEIQAWWDQKVWGAPKVKNAATVEARLEEFEKIYQANRNELQRLYEKIYGSLQALVKLSNDYEFTKTILASIPIAATTGRKYTREDIQAWWDQNVWGAVEVKNALTLEEHQAAVRVIYLDKYYEVLWLYEAVYENQSRAITELRKDYEYTMNPFDMSTTKNSSNPDQAGSNSGDSTWFDPLDFMKIRQGLKMHTFGPQPQRIKPIHQGIDLYAPIGTPIKAVMNGVIDDIGTDAEGYGLFIVLRFIKNGNTYYALYAHLSEVADKLEIKHSVIAGQILGRTGKSGKSAANMEGEDLHLHFELATSGAFGNTGLGDGRFNPQEEGFIKAKMDSK